MSRITANLGENAQGKYLVAVDLTFDELKEVRDALQDRHKLMNRTKRNKSLSIDVREKAARKSQLISNTLRGVFEAHAIIKRATHLRQEGRWRKEHGITE